MIDWSKVSTPGALPSGNTQTTTPAIPPATSDLTQSSPETQQVVPLGGTFGGSTQSTKYETGNGWRPASQDEIDAMDPGQRMARGIDYLGYLLFGNAPDQQGGEQFGYQAPLAGTGPLREVPRIAGDILHGVADWAVVKPIEVGATVLSHTPFGWIPGGSDDTFNELGAWAKDKSPEIYTMWQQTKAQADADVLYGGNLKADFNDEILRMLDDMQYDSTLGVEPNIYLGKRTAGSLGGALSHAIGGFLGLLSNESQLLFGQSGAFDPGQTQASFEDQFGAWKANQEGKAFTGSGGYSVVVGEEQSLIFRQLADGTISEADARSKIEEMQGARRSRIDEIGARVTMGLEFSEVEKQAWDAYSSGAWSKQHAEEWIVSHGQGVTRNPVGQIIGTVVTDPLTYATVGAGTFANLGKAGLRTAEAADVTIQSMKGLSLADRIAASTGNAARIAGQIPNATSNYEKVALAVAAVQKSPAGPIARAARALVDPFGAYKPNTVDRTAISLKNEVAVGALQRAHGPQSFAELEAIGRETGLVNEVRQAAANYASDQADLMVSIEARDQMIQKGLGFEMLDPSSELNNVDNVIEPMASNYATKDAQTRLVDHIVEHSRNTFTPAEEANLVHRLGTTLGGGIDWSGRVSKMGHDMKSLLHAITYKLAETDWFNAMNAVVKTAYDGELPLHLGAIMDMGTVDQKMAKQFVKDIEAILADTKRPDRIEAATKAWNDIARTSDRLGNFGYATGGEQQLKAILREVSNEIDHGGFPTIWTEQELAHPALKPLRDMLDRHSVPMSQAEIDAAKAQARKTATTAFRRKAALEARRQELKDALRSLETSTGKIKSGKKAEHDAAQKALEDFLAKHPEAKARFDVKAEMAAVEAAKLEDEAYRKGFEAAKRSKTGDVAKAKERFSAANPDNPDPNSLFEAGWADAQGGKDFGDALAAGGHGVDNLPPPGSMAPTLEETVAAAEASVTGVRRLWKVGSRPEETVAWGLKRDPNTGLPMPMREPTISHNFMAYPGKAPFSDTVRNALGQIIGTVPADKVAKPVDSMEAFIRTMQDVVTGRRLVLNMQQRFERSMFEAGVPKPLIRTIFAKAKEVAGMEETTIRGLKANEKGGLWREIANEIPRDLRLANGQALDIHTVMDHLLVAAEGDLRIMGLTSKFSQRMRNAMRNANIDPVNFSGQLTVTAYNKMRYALNPTFLIQRMTDSIYYSILYGVTPIGMGALSESNMALKAITENIARTGMARDFAFDLPEFATRANWTAGVKSALQQAGINDNMLSRIANAPDALIQHNMVNMLHARLGDIVRGTLDNLVTAIEKDATLIAGATPEQAYILRRSFADWRAVYSKNAGRVLTDNEVGFMYIRDMLAGWRRVGPINPETGMLDFSKLMHEGVMMLPSDIGSIGSIMPDTLAADLGYVGANAAAELRKDVMGTMQKVGHTFTHVPGEHDLAWLKEALVNKLGAHPDYVKRAMAYFGDTWDNFWWRMAQPIDRGGLDISEHYAKEAQQVISMLARDRGMDPWEYLSGVMLINSGTDSLDTAVGRFINFLKKGEVNAEPSDWGAFFRSHLDPSAQTTLMDAYAKAEHIAASAATGPKAGEQFIRTEADGRKFLWHVVSYDKETGNIAITTNPNGVGRTGVMTREEWDALKGAPAAKAASTPHDVPLQPPLGFITNPHVVTSGHTFPSDISHDGLFHVTTGKDGVMREGFRGSNAGEAAVDAADPAVGEGFDAWRGRLWDRLKNEGEPVPSTNGLYRAVSDAEYSAAETAGEFKPLLGEDLYVTTDPDRLAGGAYGGKGGGYIIEFNPSVPVHKTTSRTVAGMGEDAIKGANMSDVRRVYKWDPAKNDHVLILDNTTPQLQGIGSVGDTLNKGRVSFVTSSVRAQAYHDRLLLAVKAARGEITNAEIADYFIPLYQKAYGSEFAERMKSALNDNNLLTGTAHTPQQLVYMVKRLDGALFGGPGGLSPGGMKTGLSSSEGAVNLTTPFESLTKIDPEQIGVVNIATREGAAATKGMDVGELTLLPEDIRPMSIMGEFPKPASVVDNADEVKYQADLAAWQVEQDAFGNKMRNFNKDQEAYDSADAAYKIEKVNYERDLKKYDRLEKQYSVLQKEYDDIVAENASRDAQYFNEVTAYENAKHELNAQWDAYDEEVRAYDEAVRAYDEALQSSEDAMNSDAVPEPVQKVIDRWTDPKKKDPTRLRSQLEKLADEGYDVQQAESLLDEYVDMERDPGTTMEDYGYEKQDAWDAIMEELAAVPPIEDMADVPELPDMPIPPSSSRFKPDMPEPDHPGKLPLPPKPIAPKKPVEPVAPTPPTRPVEPTTPKPQPPEPKPLALEQKPAEQEAAPVQEPTIPPVDPQKFWDKGIIDMIEKRAKTGAHPNPDVEGALQKVAELTQRVLKDSKGAKNTRTTVRNLAKAIPLTNPVPYNRSHVLIQHLVQTKIEDAQRDIFRLAEMQTQRTVLERSLNHPLFGLYPSSYMWGKVLPETIKFLAKNPYAATYVINDVQRSIATQREFDPEFESKMNSVDRSAAAFWIDYMTPGLPWSDHSARVSPMVKDLLKGDLLNMLPDSLATMSPKRWYDQTLRSLQEIPGAWDAVTGSDEQTQKLKGTLGATFGGGSTAAPGIGSNQIDGAVKAVALAPILADDLSRLQDILLAGKSAEN